MQFGVQTQTHPSDCLIEECDLLCHRTIFHCFRVQWWHDLLRLALGIVSGDLMLKAWPSAMESHEVKLPVLQELWCKLATLLCNFAWSELLWLLNNETVKQQFNSWSWPNTSVHITCLNCDTVSINLYQDFFFKNHYYRLSTPNLNVCLCQVQVPGGDTDTSCGKWRELCVVAR